MAITVYQLLQEDPDLVVPLMVEQIKFLIPITLALAGLGVFCGLQLAPPLAELGGKAAAIYMGGSIMALCVITAIAVSIGIFSIYNGAIDFVCTPLMLIVGLYLCGPYEFTSIANRLMINTNSDIVVRQYIPCTSLVRGRIRHRRYTFVYAIDAKNCGLLKWQLTGPQARGANSFRDNPANREIINRFPVS